MTKKLQELFDLPLSESNTVNELQAPFVEEVTKEAYSNLEKIENALPQVRGLESADTEMDELLILQLAVTKT